MTEITIDLTGDHLEEIYKHEPCFTKLTGMLKCAYEVEKNKNEKTETLETK